MNETINKKIKVYLIARIARSEHESNEALANMLDNTLFEVFIPHKHNPYDLEQRRVSKEIADFDYNTIDKSNAAIIREPFGMDCSAEIGYCRAKGIPTVLYVENEGTWQDTWMVKHAITAIALANEDIAKIVMGDETLKQAQKMLTRTPQEISDFLYDVANDAYQNGQPK